jgi:hypothetical protein
MGDIMIHTRQVLPSNGKIVNYNFLKPKTLPRFRRLAPNSGRCSNLMEKPLQSPFIKQGGCFLGLVLNAKMENNFSDMLHHPLKMASGEHLIFGHLPYD